MGVMTDPRFDPTSPERWDPRFRTFERMSSGKWYTPGSDELEAMHARVREVLREVNALGNVDIPRAGEMLRGILAEGSHVPEWWAPMSVEYCANLSFGEKCFINTGMTIIDCAPVTVGARTLFGPNCELITVGHPVQDLEMRRAGWEIAVPITIGESCWFGSRVSVMPGVTIGDRCVIAAGTVVTRDIPDDSLVMGVPGRVVRTLNDGTSPLERDDIEL